MDETRKVTSKDIRETPWVQGDVEIPSLTLVYFAPDKDFFGADVGVISHDKDP